ncbi:hypothetical protein AOR01nite_15820 [Acetobacter orleanensis]|uniref:Uncharacterized protein n=1 Tax=Acetobacter orleanensis TaxID=104099 RepID=A0A4Y3TQP2_9PROT|nr:hypothetical protein Abol_011_024 [Acetobacter orleanensis JCM 7639]GEB83105.1 hypothetical protein AOR01nite_15820 [Acetobacter orleanensis]
MQEDEKDFVYRTLSYHSLGISVVWLDRYHGSAQFMKYSRQQTPGGARFMSRRDKKIKIGQKIVIYHKMIYSPIPFTIFT